MTVIASGLEVPSDPTKAMDYILAKYSEGHWPDFDPEAKRYFWNRGEIRTVVWFTPRVVAKADHMLAKIPEPYHMEENRHFDLVFSMLSNESIKKRTWVHGEVLEVYQHLRANGYLKSIEAITPPGGLAGAALGIDLPPIFIAETMFFVQSNGSKAALCYCIKKYASAGYQFMDVGQPHRREHPLGRLFEESMDISTYLRHMKTPNGTR
jgi:Leu/Phe-tRNA-protein transferase